MGEDANEGSLYNTKIVELYMKWRIVSDPYSADLEHFISDPDAGHKCFCTDRYPACIFYLREYNANQNSSKCRADSVLRRGCSPNTNTRHVIAG